MKKRKELVPSALKEVLEKAMYEKAFDHCNNLDLIKIEQSLEALVAVDTTDTKAYADALDNCDRVMARITRNPLFINLVETMIALRRDTMERLLVLQGSSERSKMLRSNIIKAFRTNDKTKVIEAVDRFFYESKKPLMDSGI